MVVMICPVLLALALNIVDLNGDVYGHGVPTAMITMAGFTLITGICPLLLCYFSQGFPSISPAPVTTSLATISSCCLIVLACMIAQFIVTFGVIFGTAILVRIISNYVHMFKTRNDDGRKYTTEMHRVLYELHEFLTGVTGILFLGFEGLALDGHGRTIGHMGGETMGYICFIFCTLGVCSMFLEMAPPPSYGVHRQRSEGKKRIVCLTLILDCIMVVGIFILLLVVMLKLMKPVLALLVLHPPIVSFIPLPVLVLLMGNQQDDEESMGETQDDEESKPASLELTKVTFTGFLAVSIATISNASPSNLTRYSLLLSSMAIGFGLSWRLLSQDNTKSGLNGCVSKAHVASAANLASFCAHLCIVVATILFVIMACNGRGR